MVVALRGARGSYPGMIDPAEFPLPRRITREARDLVLSLTDMPPGLTLRSDQKCENVGGDCWERGFDHPRYVVTIQVLRFFTAELAQSYLETSARSQPGSQAMSLGPQLGDSSAAQTKVTDRLATFTIESRVANAVAVVFVGGLLGLDPAVAVEMAKMQSTKLAAP